ncbi:MAG: DUF1571 domain-containing protein [Planctomycetales bacterium]|nr:DUF1571 domain-containing protein [Planctomycetales bacterium]
MKLTHCVTLLTLSAMLASVASAQTREPVYRVGAKVDRATQGESHPLDAALERARHGLQRIRKGDPARNIEPLRDYTCFMFKRERVNGKLNPTNQIFCKIRNEHIDATGRKVPFSVYMYFHGPADVKGRECIYVDGQNNNKLCAHEGGPRGNWLPTVWLKPEGALAMKGQLYPITTAGLENMVLKLIERGTAERKFRPDECQVTFKKGVTINKRPCTLLTVSHPVRRPTYEFSLAEIFIDDELELPVRYVAYDWPKSGEAKGEIQEEYTHVEIKTNVGLKDIDFDPKNPDYNF